MAGKGDIEAGRAFVEIFLKNSLTDALNGAIAKARAGLAQFSKMAMTAGRALTKVGVAISASYIAIASGNALVAQKAALIHKTLANAIAPAVIPILEKTLQIAQATARWMSHNQGIVTLVLRIGLWMVAIGSSLKLAAAAAKALSLALQLVQMAALNVAFIIRTTWIVPLLAVLGTLLVIGVLVHRYSESWREFFNQNASDVATWGKNMLGTINSFVNAISDGRLALAWQIALTAMKLEWNKFQNLVLFGWVKIFDLVENLPTNMWTLQLKTFLLEVRRTLKDMEAEALRGDDLKALKAQLEALKKTADERLSFTPFGSAAQTKSSITAGGAVALGFGALGQDIAKKSFEELQAIKRAAFEMLKTIKDAAARRERPGIFGP